MKKIFVLVLSIFILFNFTSCAFIHKSIDDKYKFSKLIGEVIKFLNEENWSEGNKSLEKAKEAWEKVKPLIQIDVDHDYVFSIEEKFVKLKVYIMEEDKVNGSVEAHLILEEWENIGNI